MTVTVRNQESVSLVIKKMIASAVIPGLGLIQGGLLINTWVNAAAFWRDNGEKGTNAMGYILI